MPATASSDSSQPPLFHVVGFSGQRQVADRKSLERIVLRTERALLQEILEWHSITSFGESH